MRMYKMCVKKTICQPNKRYMKNVNIILYYVYHHKSLKCERKKMMENIKQKKSKNTNSK